jgi:hypothetical protein
MEAARQPFMFQPYVRKIVPIHPDRFILGTDSVAPKDAPAFQKTYHLYDPFWPLLTKETSLKVRKGNYERVFDQAKTKVRAWEESQGFGAIETSLTAR